MILKMFSILDIKSDTFNTPFFFKAVGEAVRAFSDLANDANTTVGKHPEDYKLIQIGVFDDNTGVVLADEDCPKSLGFANDFVKHGVVEFAKGKKVS